MDEALDRTRLQRAFHRRLFEIHPDAQNARIETVQDVVPSDQPSVHGQPSAIDDSSGVTGSSGAENVARPAAPVLRRDLSVDTLIEARKTLLIRLERGNDALDTKPSKTTGGAEFNGGQKKDPGPSGADGYKLYRRALFLYSEAVLNYFEKRKHVSGRTVSAPTAEPEGFRSTLEEARSLFVQVLERFPGGTWTPDSIEQIARINVWLKRDSASGSQVPK